MFKNDNFFKATLEENQKKKLQQIQNLNQPTHKQNAQTRKKIALDKKQQQKKQQIKIHDRSIFQPHNHNQFVFDDFLGINSKKQKQDQDFQFLKKKIQEKKDKKNTTNAEENNTNFDQKKQLLHVQTKINNSEKNKENEKFVIKSKIDDDDNFDELLSALKTTEFHSIQQQKQQQKPHLQSKPQKLKEQKQPFKPPTIFKPKSTIIQLAPQPLKNQTQKQKSTYQLNKQRVMFQKQIKKQLQDKQLKQKKTIESKSGQNNQQEGSTNKQNTNQKKQKGNKKIKKVNNYQRLDLKRKYKDQFVGGLRENQRKFMKNGALKPKYRMAQTELQMDLSQVYNTYVHSLSRSFKVDIILDSDSQEVQLQPDKNVQIPRIQECNEERLTALIEQMFGFQKFRQGQYEVIKNILSHKSTIFVSETASGKSLTYIISAMIMAKQFEGMSIVISPLIALMLDQLQHLPQELPAACISSLVNYQQRDRILQLVKSKQVKLLFMTPQMLQSDILFHLQQFPKINFVCIDEAHCLSQLSHNFRTSYMALAQIIKNHISYNNQFHKPNILCLTATANTQTIDSLATKLQIQHIIKSSSTLNKNLYITVTRQVGLEDKYRALVDYLNHEQIIKCKGVLIYCKAKWIIEKVFNYLSNSGITAVVFHGQLTAKQKTKIIAQFKSRVVRIIISTTALGMGLDFEHLDCIIHFNMSKSLQSYVQEIGRAGRRQSRAYCQLFLDPSDFYYERNYILADQLEQQSLKTIVSEMQKSWRGRPFNYKKKQNQDKNDVDQHQMNRIIKKVSLAIQKMQENQRQQRMILGDEQLHDQGISVQDQLEQQSNPFQENNKDQNGWSPLYYLRSKELSQKTYLRQQALLGILMKLSSQLNLQVTNNHLKSLQMPNDYIQNQVNSKRQLQIMKIHPLSNQILKLSFFKNNQKLLIQSEQHGQFYSKLVDIDLKSKDKKPKCKKANGAYHIHLIQKCNQLRMTPIQILTKVYQISNTYVMKVQFVNQVFVFSIADNLQIQQDKQSVKIQNKDIKPQKKDIKVSKKEVQLCLQNMIFQQAVINQVNQVQNTSMTKLQVFYSLAFDFSLKSVSELKNKKYIIDRATPIPTNSIMGKITKYFNTDLLTFYNELTQTQDQYQRQMYLPTESIQPEEVNNVYQYVKLFFKHQFSNLRDMHNRTQALRKKDTIIDQYKDGKVITRVFLGVNEQKSSRFIYGEHSYWRVFLKKKYFPLLKTVRQVIHQGRQDLLIC